MQGLCSSQAGKSYCQPLCLLAQQLLQLGMHLHDHMVG